MIDNDDESNIDQQNAIEGTDKEELLKRELWEHPEVLELVLERKKRKFTRSGLLLILIGIILIAAGLMLNIGVHSIAVIIVATGVIVALVGILRILIGLIKPIVPSQM